MQTVVPLQRSASKWLRKPGRIWFSWSIFNPNGPTVSCVGLRDTARPGQAEAFYRWMHLLGGEDYRLGYVDTTTSQAEEQIARIFSTAFTLQPGQGFARFPMVTCIPSLVVANVSEDWLDVFRDGLARSAAIQGADWGRERYFLSKYGSRVFDRAGEELREAYERMRRELAEGDQQGSDRLDMMYAVYQQVPTFANWEPGRYVSRGIKAGDFDAWWDTITAIPFWPPVAAQIGHAWNNAIKQSTVPYQTPMAEVREFFAAYGMPVFNDQAP